MTPEQIVEGIQAIVANVRTKSPKTKVLVLCLFPRAKGNEGPASVNKLLPKLHDDKNVFVLDVGHNFLAADGTLPKEIFRDGLHPSEKGYDIWAESIEAMDEESGGVERQMPVVTVNPTAGLERGELRQRIDQALGQLSYEHRMSLVLHEFEDMEYKEIASTMGCSIGTVMSRLFYARRKLAVLLSDLKNRDSV